jgi:hypothetical protein
MKFILDFEVGGQDIEWHVEYTPETQDTRDEPGCDAELSVEKAMLLTCQHGNVNHYLDILDLLEEANDGELSERIYSELLDKAGQAYDEARDDYEASRAEALARDRGDCDA